MCLETAGKLKSAKSMAVKPHTTITKWCDGICNKFMHYKCVGMTRTIFKAYGDLDNLHYMCDKCANLSLKAMNQKLDKIMSIIRIYDERMTRYEKNMEHLIENTNGLTKLLQLPVFSGSNASCVSDELANNQSPMIKKSKAHSVMLKPKGESAVILIKPKENQGCEVTESDFKSSIDPKSVNVKRFRKGPKGKIAIICDGDEASEEVKRIAGAKLSDKYSIEKPIPVRKRVKITEICDSLTNDEILNAMKVQNEFMQDSSINIVQSYKVKRFNSISVKKGKDILYVNAQSLYANIDSVRKLLIDEKPMILMVSETV
ncbi:hypothetical protein Bhyg_03276 [Pseudolycoriella hygida]|uniref:Uncharacterized protein n=1 Tax=Pseudolycoriella hygida TaxID=35572 RepID=A0A9Q0NEA1_9DIPT|nr:hypothetical protein Bhyg_03276 [Pseudolycoriella hygida]